MYFKPILVLAATFIASSASAQVLTVRGEAGRSTQLSAQALAALPHVSITTGEHGRSVTYDGVPLSTLTALVGAPQGEALRGPAFAMVVIVTAQDGYRIVLSLAETDPSIRAERSIIADRADGAPLDARSGPFRLVVEGDKRPARAARNVQSIEVKTLP